MERRSRRGGYGKNNGDSNTPTMENGLGDSTFLAENGVWDGYIVIIINATTAGLNGMLCLYPVVSTRDGCIIR